jgi:hypothetical protein
MTAKSDTNPIRSRARAAHQKCPYSGDGLHIAVDPRSIKYPRRIAGEKAEIQLQQMAQQIILQISYGLFGNFGHEDPVHHGEHASDQK